MRTDSIFLAHTLLRLQHRDFVVAGVTFHPPPVLQGSLGQDLRGDRILTVHVAEEVHDMLRPRQQRQVPLDDDAVETVIYKNQEALKELREGFHRSPPLMFGWIPKSSVRATGGINRPAPAGSDFLALGFQGRSPWLPREPQRTLFRNATCSRDLGQQAQRREADGDNEINKELLHATSRHG